MAKAKETAETVTEEVKETAPKTVKIKLFKDNGKYKDDVFVGVGGGSWQIQRGVEVEVPEVVAQVLEQSFKQDAATADLIMRESSK